MESNDLRNSFFNFFRNKNHQIVSSAPMVIKGDPTLMFTNAGMNPFKDIFIGVTPVKYPRVANTQKCLRVSGKHNDLEEVGIDTYHHTMFEMLGNWSFGNPAHPAGGYFKKEAISWAWDFLTDLLKIDKNRLYATVFEGSKEDKTAWDKEAYHYWEAYLPKDRILKGNKKDNFWEMGDTGPCGPCSEIHIDLRDESEREKIPGNDLVNKDHPQVIEIWNLVFIQFNRKANGSLETLPQKHVDTGMGFERLCMVMQQKKSTYDTDIFQPIISKTSELCGKSYGDDLKTDIAMRVIADHIRAIAFSIADGQLPSNNLAGYVIRRILRRAVRYGFTFLGLKEPFLFQLVPVLAHKMGDPFPELKAQQPLIEKVIKEEEISFLKTLETGIRLLEQIIENTRSQNYNVVNGKMAFELYDTYGFPLDLTELILKENDLVVNRKEFEEEMKKQKDRSRNAATMEAGDWTELRADDEEEFIGYERTEADVYITRYRKIKRKGKEHYQLVFNITPFYAESGGQVGDTGTLTNEEESIEIIDTQKENNLIVHFTKGLPKNPGAKFRAIVEREKRKLTANNHTATHLLHHALRKVLGNHVEQKGSLVSPDHLRFDFSHFQKISEEDIRQVETFVNEEIRNNYVLDERRNIPMDEAKDLGAIALFGEKYGDLVRVIKFGDSTELCGGTHVQATGQIGFFKIVSESAIAAGIRRIEAITAEKAEKYIHEQLNILNEIKQTIKSSKNLMDSIHGLIKENAALSKQLEKFGKEALKIAKHNLKSRVIEINGIQVIAEKVELESADALKDLSFQLRSEIENLFLVLGSEIDGKASLSVMISDNLVKEKGLHAGNIIREIAKEIRGGGGGQPFFATAGGKDPEKIGNALAKAKQMLEKV